MSTFKQLQTKIQSLIYGDNPEHKRRDALKPGTDPDYMMNSPQVVGYNTTDEQLFMFQNVLVGYSPTQTILDVGCGRADMCNFIQDFFGEPAPYYGVDHNPLMADIAKEKYGYDIITGAFETAELPTVDWVVASGFFTQRRCETEDADLIKMFVDIDRMYELANQAVSFNLLSPINNTIHKGFFYVHPGLVMDMLIEKYRYVNVRHNYANDVYTVTIYKIQ